MSAKLTPSQLALLAWIDREGYIHEDDAARLPGIHFCPDWDFLAVCNASPEKDGCHCITDTTQPDTRDEGAVR